MAGLSMPFAVLGARVRRTTAMRDESDGLGRSGSTLLMEALGAHPRIALYPRQPYESAPARYWAHVLRVVAEHRTHRLRRR